MDAPGPSKHLPVVGQVPKSRTFHAADVRKRPRPAYAVWEFTLACDQRCMACGPRAGKRRSNELTTQESLALVDQLAELGVGEITFIGGEAYLRSDLPDVIRRAREHGVRASTTTGARGLNAARLTTLVEAGLQQVGYSIDGVEATRDAVRSLGSFARAFASMREAKALGLRVSANTQINWRSLDDLVPLAHQLVEAGIAGWQPILTIPHGNAADVPELILQPYMLPEAYVQLEAVLDLFDAHGIGVWPGNNLGYFGPLEHRLRRRQNSNAHYKGCQAGTSIVGVESDGTLKSCPTLSREGHSPGSVVLNRVRARRRHTGRLLGMVWRAQCPTRCACYPRWAVGERRLATYDDVLRAPRHVVAEVVQGTLRTHPRPRLRHAAAASALGEELGPPFRRGRGGPGGWIILDEPELHLGEDILVPDLAAWRRERMPELPDTPYATLAPDWVCEVLSKSTEAFDRSDKLPIYAREGVHHVWLVDPEIRTLEVFRLDGEGYRLIETRAGAASVRAEPFDAIELSLDLLWNV